MLRDAHRHARAPASAGTHRRGRGTAFGRAPPRRARRAARNRHGDPRRRAAPRRRDGRGRRRDRGPRRHLRRRGDEVHALPRASAEVHLRAHNAGFCRPCFIGFFRRHVERAIAAEHMCTHRRARPGRRLRRQGQPRAVGRAGRARLPDDGPVPGPASAPTRTDRARRSRRSRARAGCRCASSTLAAEGPGLAVPDVAGAHAPVGLLGLRHDQAALLRRAALAGEFDVLATGHNLDDEAARLLGNVLRWQVDHLARQRPVLPPTHPRFVRKVKPLYLLSEYETAVYAFMRGIDYVVEECPNARARRSCVYKDALNRLEAASPGTKLAFVQEFLRTGQPAFAARADDQRPPQTCARCGMPACGELCAFCQLVARGRDASARAARRRSRRRERTAPASSGRRRAARCATASRSCCIDRKERAVPAHPRRGGRMTHRAARRFPATT